MSIRRRTQTAGRRGAIRVVFNALGESIRCVAVPVEEIESLGDDEIPAVRRLVRQR
jgi:hypothetical protein